MTAPLDRLTPASLAWLAAYDMLLGLRRLGEILSGLKPRWRPVAIGVAVLVAHAVAWPVARWIAAAAADPARAGLVQGGLAAILAFVASWMLAQSLMTVTRALFVRGDLDLLLSAPLPASKIVAARAIGLFMEAFGSGGFLLLPIANALALQGHAHWLGLYPVLIAMALATSSAGLALALGLFHIVGPKRARTISQVLAMTIGAAVALGIQALAVLPRDMRSSLLAALDLAPSAVRDGGSVPAWWPLAAVQGDAGSIVLLLLAGCTAFLLATRYLGPAFTASVLRSAGSDATVGSPRRSLVALPFTQEWRGVLRRKELALITRDPWVLGQLVLQMVYTLPIAFILWRSGIGQAIPAVAVTPSLVIIASQVAGSLAWIAISGEDAPEFMATTPVSRSAVEWAKLEAIALMVGALLVVPIVLVALTSIVAALVALAFAAAAGASCALVNLWHPTDGRRRSFMRRHQQSKLISLFEHAMLLVWAVAGAVAQINVLVALVPALLAVGLLMLARRVLVGRRQRAKSVGLSEMAAVGQPVPTA